MKLARTHVWFGALVLAICAGRGSGQTSSVLYAFTGDAAGDGCGSAVAPAGDVDGDGTKDVVVGHYGAPGGSYAGRVRVHSGATGAILFTLEGGAAGDQFGASVDGAGDVNGDGFADIIVGAPNANTAGTDSGLAKVFAGPSGTLLYTFTGAAAVDHFGCSVSGAGDLNGDGRADVVIGAFGADTNGTDSGSVRVYSGLTGAQMFAFNGTAAGDWFGFAVDGGGDLNNDGVPDIVIGAPGSDMGGDYSGSVRGISGATGAVLFTVAGVGGTFGVAPGDLMGYSVAFAGHVNTDAFADVVAGRPGSSAGSYAGGGLRVLAGPSGTTLFNVAGTMLLEGVGYSVSGVGDVNGDGRDEIIGGSYTASTAPVPGVARVYSGLNGAVLYTINGGSVAGDSFGQAVAGLGDLNADGRREVAIGAPLADPNGSGSGILRVITLLPLAQTSALGIGCGGATVQPALNSTLPRLGQNVTLTILSGPPGVLGVVAASAPSAPLPLGSGCTVFVDPAAFTQIWAPMLSATGGASLTVAVPNVSALAGVQLVAQGIFPGTTGPLGFHLTNGRLLTLGY